MAVAARGPLLRCLGVGAPPTARRQPVSSGSGGRQDVDTFGARLQQCLRQLIGCRAGRDDVVDDQRLPVTETFASYESVAQITVPLGGAQARLWTGRVPTNCAVEERQASCAGQRPGYFTGLVEAAPNVPPAVQRDRNQCIAVCEFPIKTVQHEFGQRRRVHRLAAEFEFLDGAVDGELVEQRCASQRESPRFLLAVPTWRVNGTGHGLAAADAIYFVPRQDGQAAVADTRCPDRLRAKDTA